MSTVELDAASADDGCLLLKPSELAQRLGISVRHVYRLLDSGQLPRPIRLGRCVRFHAAEIANWLAAEGGRGGKP